LSRFADRPVIDATGLPGLFEFKLEWSTGSGQADAQDQLFGAVERELGLRFEGSKAPMQVMTVDHLEKVPSGN
jgi:uncharacterized protein (TIGR03435 family)